jgi:Flp pilus assembly protein TadB
MRRDSEEGRAMGGEHPHAGDGPEVERPAARREEAPPLGDVVRDAADQLKAMARDGATMARMEARRMVRGAAPRVGWGAAFAACALAGSVLAAIAIFLGLGLLIGSVAVRLGLYAVAFLVVAAYAASRARRTTLAGPSLPEPTDRAAGDRAPFRRE